MMASFLADMTSLLNFCFSCFRSIFGLYTTAYILIAVFALWVVRKIFRLFEYLRP